MFQGKILISKLGCTVDRAASGSIAIDKIPALNHEVFDLGQVSSSSYPILGVRHVQLGGICSLCSPEAVPWDSCSRRCRTAESSPLSAV